MDFSKCKTILERNFFSLQAQDFVNNIMPFKNINFHISRGMNPFEILNRL